MTTHNYDVCAIGNAIVDVIAACDEAFLEQQNITKGVMSLIDAALAEELYGLMQNPLETSGGSAANTMAGIASLGGKAAYVGKVKHDKLGDSFRRDMRNVGVHFDTEPLTESSAPPTARSLILVTPDGERSMNTFLGASTQITSEDIAAAEEIIAGAKVTYLEGYLFDTPITQAAYHHAAGIAKAAGRKVALSLSDTFCVMAHRAAFRKLVREGVDILFANEAEITALYQTDDFESAVLQASHECELVVATRGKQGAVIISHGQRTEVPAAPVARVVDTTGAGDQFAAGFLYGYTQGKDPAECGRIAAIAAAEVISHFGPRPQVALNSLIA